MKVGSVNATRAQQQHAAFVRTLEAAGAQVVALPFIHEAYDSIFAKDCAVLTSDGTRRRALVARPRCIERRVERAHRARHLTSAGFEVDRSCAAPLEGGDVALHAPEGFALLGTGFRSAPEAAPALARFLGVPVIPLELVDPRLYHLDMAMSVLADGTALVCEDAFSAASRAAIRELPLREIIPVSAAAALRFAVNVVELGDTVITASDAPDAAAALRARGRDVIVVELDEFHHAGGSAACLVSRVHTYGTTAHNATAAMRSTAA